jgi:acetyl-CoA carboxylase carboxyltransferase component
VHARATGVASLVVGNEDEARTATEELVTLLPASADELPPRLHTEDPGRRATPEAGDVIPSSPTGSYDVREIVRCLVDDGELLELRASWAGNVVTALATFDGRPTGIVANQPMTVAGTLDIAASQKAARFVAFCDAFNIPLVTLVDTPGFYPGKDVEWRGMIRHGAQLAFAYSRATVPRVSVTLRKSYGGAYIVMDSKRTGNDVALAWPTAEIAVMGARGAVEILHRRESDASRRAELEQAYEQRLLNPYIAAERGLIDAVVEPADTRRAIVDALDVLVHKREQPRHRAHDNTPL